MGEARYSKKAKILTVFLMISLLIVSFSPVLINNADVTSLTNKPNETTDVQQGINSESAPSGPPRPITEYALGTRTGISVNLPSSPNAYIDLGSAWIGNSAIVNVTYLWDSRNHAVNGTFDYGSGTSSPPWSFSKYDPLGHSTFTGSWVQNSPQSGVKDIYCQMPLPSGSINFNGNERVSWNETIWPLRGTVLSAVLTFDWWPVVATGFTRSEFVFYSTVNNTRLIGVGSPFPWQVNLKDVASNPLVNNRWNTANFTVPTSAFSLPTKKISIEIGIMYTSGVATYTGWNSQNIMYIDNVKLVLQCYVKPHQINLKVRPQGGLNSTFSDSSQYGSGIAVLKGFTTSGASFPFIFAGGNLSSPNKAGLTCAISMNTTRATYAQSTFETYGSGQEISWTFSFWTYFQQNNQPVGSGTYYTKYCFNISVPLDYNFTTCKDPDYTVHNINSEAPFKNWTAASSVVLRVNVTQIGSYTSPTNPSPGFKPYEIHALSSNYVKQIFTQIWDGAHWMSSTNFYPQNLTNIAARIAAGLTPITGGIANLTIYGPPAYNSTPLILYKTITGHPAVNGFANFTVQWNSTAGQAGYVAGNYTVQVDWVNRTLGEAGSLQYAFNITHKIQLRITIPGQGDVVLAGTQILSPPTTVSVRDYYTGEFVKTEIKGRVKWETPGRWDTFATYSAVNATYTNVTYVPSDLTAGSTQWLAVNASKKPYFDEAKTNSTFLIGWEATITPPSQVVSTYCTEKSDREIVLSSIYYYNVHGGSPITNATITVVSEASSNDSVLKWSYRFDPDTTGNSTGYYSGTIKIGTVSALLKAIPPSVGYSYTIVFKLYQGQYVQTKYFPVTLVLFPSPCSLDVLSGGEQSVFWGQTATATLNFSAQTPSLPILPVYNSDIYAPPYVSVQHNWTGSWSIAEIGLQPGHYIFQINTSAWAHPTIDGSGAGTVKILVRLDKIYYTSTGTTKTITLHIKSLTTSMTGATGSIGSLTLTNTTWVYSGEQKTIFTWYNDTHSGAPVGVGGASVNYALKAPNGTTLSTGALQGVTGKQGLYDLTLPRTLTDLMPGAYFLNITASKLDFYVMRSVIVTLDVRPIPTTIQAFSPPTTIYYLDKFMFLMWFNDTHNNVPLTGAMLTLSLPQGMTVYSPTPVPIVPGLYNLTVPGVNPVGEYTINVTASKAKYASGVVSLPATINKLPTILVPYVNSTSGPVLVQQNVTADLGTSLTIYLWFNDTHNSRSIPGAENYITYRSTNSKWGPGLASPVSGVPGLYQVTLQISDAGAYDITFNATFTNYDPQLLTFTVNVPAPPPGFSLATLMLVGFGGGGIVVVGAVAWLLMRRARIPFVIKKIDETLKLISKGEHEQATPVPLKSREESIVGITQERIEAFSKRKPVAGAPEEPPTEKAPEAAAAAAPTAEVEKALKKELKAVEPGKPEEEIEEVEMETLDEELGRLEKVDTGQEVPAGAKQARDVIEEYKKRKKKR